MLAPSVRDARLLRSSSCEHLSPTVYPEGCRSSVYVLSPYLSYLAPYWFAVFWGGSNNSRPNPAGGLFQRKYQRFKEMPVLAFGCARFVSVANPRNEVTIQGRCQAQCRERGVDLSRDRFKAINHLATPLLHTVGQLINNDFAGVIQPSVGFIALTWQFVHWDHPRTLLKNHYHAWERR